MALEGPTDVVVLGGGITGLTAAYTLTQLRPDAAIVLIESSSALGGKIATVNLDGVTLETGADSFLARDPVAVDLCTELGLGGELVAPTVFGAVVAGRNGLHRMPRGFVYGMPASLGAVARASMLSLAARLRVAADLVVPGRVDDDISVASLVTRRFGRSLLEEVVDPLLAGTRAGDVNDMSLAATLPPIYAAARSSRSVIRGLGRAMRRDGLDRPPPFVTVRDGLSRLIHQLSDRLSSTDIRTSTNAVAVDGSGPFTVTTSAGAVTASAVIVATPAHVIAPLVAGLSPDAGAALEAIEHASVASVALVYDELDFTPPPDTSGLLVSAAVQEVIAGCTWYSTKWPHTATQDRRVLRTFVGRSGNHPALDRTDDELVAAIVDDLERLLGIRDAPVASHVTRWPLSMPQYSVGHLERVSLAERALGRDAPGVVVAGAALHGSGIPDCVIQGRRAAAQVAEALDNR